MSVKVIEPAKRTVYITTCDKCGAKLEYTSEDIQRNDDYPDGFLQCPCCSNAIKHKNSTEKDSKLTKDEENLIKRYTLQIESLKSVSNKILIFEIIAFIIAAVFFVLGFCFQNVIYFIVVIFPVVFGIALILVRLFACENRIDNRMAAIKRLQEKEK